LCFKRFVITEQRRNFGQKRTYIYKYETVGRFFYSFVFIVQRSVYLPYDSLCARVFYIIVSGVRKSLDVFYHTHTHTYTYTHALLSKKKVENAMSRAISVYGRIIFRSRIPTVR